MKYIEHRRMESSVMRGLCINHNWYNAGTNAEYGQLLYTLCGQHDLTTDDVAAIVDDIIAHTLEFRSVTDPEAKAAIVFNVSTEVFNHMTMWLEAA